MSQDTFRARHGVTADDETTIGGLEEDVRQARGEAESLRLELEAAEKENAALKQQLEAARSGTAVEG